MRSDSQKAIVLDHLRQRSITPKDAYELYGIMRLAAIIWELRDAGYLIKTDTITSLNRFGKIVNYAEYSLETVAA